ncbi:hypothetical protein TNCV_4103611 [Trichonephila clavipes]|nr:hypothetical protein TNCV_4103611 [Trichonephila clavipes]
MADERKKVKKNTPFGNSGQGRGVWETVNLFLERIKGVCELEGRSGRLRTIDPLHLRSMVQVPVHDGFNAWSIKRGWQRLVSLQGEGIKKMTKVPGQVQKEQLTILRFSPPFESQSPMVSNEVLRKS